MPPIKTARHWHGVATAQQYEALHRQKLAQASKRVGDPLLEPWLTLTPLVAFINDGAWVGRCACGAGIGVEPTWPESRCFACGAVYTTVVLPTPETRAQIEQVLMQRPRAANQNWEPHETVGDLTAENDAHIGALRAR